MIDQIQSDRAPLRHRYIDRMALFVMILLGLNL